MRRALALLAGLALVVALVPSAAYAVTSVDATYTAHTGSIAVSVGASIADAVNTPDDGKFIQMALASTITLAFPGGTYAAPDGTGAADLTVHTYDALYRADATVKVYVKSNTNDWVALGSIRDDQGDVGLNLEGVGLVNEVRLVQDGYIDPAYPDLGFDLDAVTADHTVALTESCASVTPGVYSGWAFQNKDFVSAVGLGNATPVVTTGALVDGIGYRFEAKGLYSGGPAVGPGTEILADARYSQRVVGQAVPGDSVFGYEGFGPTLLDLLLDGAAADWQGTSFNADHAYTADRAGAGAPATFQFQVYDVYANNNIGGLCVSLYEDAMAPDVSDLDVSSTAGGSITLTANADDTPKGGSDIASAQYSVDGGTTWLPMSANDGSFDEPLESVEATFGGPDAGTSWSVCVRATDAAGNTSDPACSLLRTLIEASGAIAPVPLSSPPDYKAYGEKGEPDFALEAYVYDFGGTLGGVVNVNYKLLRTTCTFTPGGAGTYDYQASPIKVASLRNWANSCAGTVTMQFLDRTSAWTVLSGFDHPRGAIFVDASNNAYDVSSGNPSLPPVYGWVPVDRGNVYTEGT